MVVDVLNIIKLSVTPALSHLVTWTKEEEIWGESDEQYKISLYYYASLYAYLIMISLTRDGYTWNEVKKKYCINEFTKCLACKGITFKDYLAVYGIPFDSDTCGGINHQQIEKTFGIEVDDCIDLAFDADVVDVELLLSTGKSCTWTEGFGNYSSYINQI